MYRLILSILYGMAISGCSVAQQPSNKQSNMMIANPAVTHCINEGLKTEPVVVNGVPSAYFCINPNSGEKCEAWAYYRKECTFTKK
jgi:putative hemolysin